MSLLLHSLAFTGVSTVTYTPPAAVPLLLLDSVITTHKFFLVVSANNTKPFFSPINTHIKCWWPKHTFFAHPDFCRTPRFYSQHYYCSDYQESLFEFTRSEPMTTTSSYSFLVQILVIACLYYYNSLLAGLPTDLSPACTAHTESSSLSDFVHTKLFRFIPSSLAPHFAFKPSTLLSLCSQWCDDLPTSDRTTQSLPISKPELKTLSSQNISHPHFPLSSLCTFIWSHCFRFKNYSCMTFVFSFFSSYISLPISLYINCNHAWISMCGLSPCFKHNKSSFHRSQYLFRQRFNTFWHIDLLTCLINVGFVTNNRRLPRQTLMQKNLKVASL